MKVSETSNSIANWKAKNSLSRHIYIEFNSVLMYFCLNIKTLRKKVFILKQLTLRMDDFLHKEIKVLAAQNGKSITEMVLEWLKKKIKLKTKEKNIEIPPETMEAIEELKSGKGFKFNKLSDAIKELELND